MKKNFLLFLLLANYIFLSAQELNRKCLSGNCKTGIGTMLIGDTKYSGAFVNGKFNGKGKLVFASGKKYEGNFKNNFFDGRGTYYLNDSEKFTGVFANGVIVSGSGTYFFDADSIKITGTMTNGKYSGPAVCILKDKSVYTGNLVNSQYEGEGTLVFANGNVYKGQFKNGKYDGNGIFSFINGTSFQGVFSDGEFFNGTFKYVDGYSYSGWWKNGKRNGFGTLTDKQGAIIYKNVWENDAMKYPKESTQYAEQQLAFSKNMLLRYFSGALTLTIYGNRGNVRSAIEIQTLDVNYNLTGKWTTTISINNKDYTVVTKISGYYNPDLFQMHIQEDYFISVDELPDGYFTLGSANLTILNNSQKSGHYILRGKTNGGNDVELQDYK